jgi:hypothetical protein
MNNPMEQFTVEEQVTILEIARLALSDGETFDHIADKLDMDDGEVKALQEMIEGVTNG